MKLKDILTLVLTTAAPVAATIIGGPGAGVLVATAVGSAGGVKKLGQKVESAGAGPVHKLASPLAAVVAPSIVATQLPPEWIDQVCDLITKVCANPGAALGVASLAWYALSNGFGMMFHKR